MEKRRRRRRQREKESCGCCCVSFRKATKVICLMQAGKSRKQKINIYNVRLVSENYVLCRCRSVYGTYGIAWHVRVYFLRNIALVAAAAFPLPFNEIYMYFILHRTPSEMHVACGYTYLYTYLYILNETRHVPWQVHTASTLWPEYDLPNDNTKIHSNSFISSLAVFVHFLYFIYISGTRSGREKREGKRERKRRERTRTVMWWKHKEWKANTRRWYCWILLYFFLAARIRWLHAYTHTRTRDSHAPEIPIIFVSRQREMRFIYLYSVAFMRSLSFFVRFHPFSIGK